MRENKCENSSGMANGFIEQDLLVVYKYSGGLVVEPAHALEVAKRGTRVQTLLREAKSRGRASVPTTYQPARVQVAAISFLEASSNGRTSISADS